MHDVTHAGVTVATPHTLPENPRAPQLYCRWSYSHKRKAAWDAALRCVCSRGEDKAWEPDQAFAATPRAPAVHAIDALTARLCQYSAAGQACGNASAMGGNITAWDSDSARRHPRRCARCDPTHAVGIGTSARTSGVFADGQTSTDAKWRAMRLRGACAAGPRKNLGSQTKRLRRRRARQPCRRSTCVLRECVSTGLQ